ncbi:hypothetical protein [Zavarzinella formosa]|uniref:hypothetical protein n=1 Tax=Zavarzinella formosa TaxID=360055 RepID=UPI0002E5B424|nr:hypothetical protein [Zavarzinella formosa]
MKIVVAQVLASIGLLLAGPVTSKAVDWHTPDRAISVARPDLARFDPAPPDADVVGEWNSKDGKIRLLVSVVPAPPGAQRIDKTALEQVVLAELSEIQKNVRLIDSSVEDQGDRQVFALVFEGENEDSHCQMVFRVSLVNSKVYKILAVGLGTDPREHPDAAKFISSFKILASNVDTSAPDEVANIPRMMGQVLGILLPIILILWLVQRGRGQKPRRSSPLPRGRDSGGDN